MISKIQLKRFDGSVIFEYEDKDNSVKKTLEVYIKEERESNKGIIDLRFADLSNADLSNADLSFADLTDADLSNAKLIRADLRFSDLSDANLRGADLSDADLSGANLSGANLRGADLISADLTYALLMGANLMYADLKDTNLRNAYFSNAILISVKNLQYATCSFAGHGECGRQLLGVKINNEIRLFCGCFNGNEAELRTYIEEGEEKYKASRLIALDTVLKLINVEKS